jgi:hypothetical protein
MKNNLFVSQTTNMRLEPPDIQYSTCRIPVVQKNEWCRIPGEIFIMSNRKSLEKVENW